MRRLFRLLLASLLLLGVATGGLLWRLDQGPLSLALIEPLLRPLIERSLPFQVAFAEPTLVWLREEGSVAVQVRDLEVRNPAGELVAGAPRARVVVATAPLLERRIAPEIIELELPRLELTREADGGLVLGFAGELAALDLDGEGLGRLLGDAAGGGSSSDAGPAGLDELRLIRVSAPALVYSDAATGQATTASEAQLELRRDAGPWTGALSARLGEGRMRATVTAAPEGGRAVRVEVDDFPLQGLQALLPDLPRVRLDLPVTGEVAFTTPPGGFLPGPGRLQLATTGGSLALPENGLAPVPINRAALTAQLDPGWQAGRIERFELVANGFTLDATGTVALADGRPRADLELRARDLDPPEILSLWPQTLAPGGRRWVAANVLAGEVDAASLHLGGPPPRPDQRDIGGSFAFSGVELRYLPAFPNATGLSGEARAAGDTLSIDLAAGSSGEVALSGGDVALTNLVGTGPAGLAVTLDVASTVPAALALLDHEPVALRERTGLAAAGTAGRQTTQLELSLPLLDNIPAEQVLYRARTRLADLRLPEVRPGYGLAADAVRLTVAQTGLDAAGDVRVNGVPFAVDWRETFGRDTRRTVELKGRLDAADAKALRLDWPSPLNGRVGVALLLTEAKQPLRTVDLDLDLGEAGIAVPALLLTKPPGQPGTASARIVQTGADTVTVEDLEVAAGALAAAGSLGLRLEPLRAERVTLGRLETPLGRGSADLAWRANAWQGRIDLGDVDLRPLRQERATREATSAPTPIPDFAVDVTARSLRLGDAPLTGLKGRVERRSGIWQAAKLQAGIEDSKVTLDLATAARTALTVRANDAGWLIRAFAASDNGVRGGQFRLAADLSQSQRGAVGTGELKIRDFTLYGAPLIARIVSLASFSGLSNALSGKGVPVTRLVVPFALDRDRLTITEARLVAADIGARATGTIGLKTGTLAIDGTVAPAYTINRILGGIPILGQIFSGRGSDAALAATFSMRNTLADPQVAVNPLSALVPGMIRDLFAALTAPDSDGAQDKGGGASTTR